MPRVRVVPYCSKTWVSTKEASELLGLTVSTLYRLIDDGHLTAYRFGRVIRLREIDIDTFIASSQIKPGSLHQHRQDELDGCDE